MRTKVASALLFTAAAFIAGGGTASATMKMQKAAKNAGIEVTGNCLYCHNEKLPKKDAYTNNPRGQWLLAEMKKRDAKEIDVAWLKDYVEEKK